MRWVEIGDLYVAYRKAKADAYFDRGHFHSIAYADYEADLERNLNRLLGRIHRNDEWSRSRNFIGRYSYLPKSVEFPKSGGGRDIHFATLNPIEDWSASFRGWRVSAKKPNALLGSSYRPIIVPTVDFQILSALWVMRVGCVYDASIDRNLAYAHRIKRVGKGGRVNEESYQLFEPYFSGYRSWRSKGLGSIKDALNRNIPVIAITMDIESFYHRVSPKFLLNKTFLSRLGIDLSGQFVEFTRLIIESLETWYRQTPEFSRRTDGALPVGLSASRVISNVVLAEFDRVVAAMDQTIHYGRYADDIFLVVRADEDIRSGEEFIQWLRKLLDPYLVLADKGAGTTGLRLKLPYASDSDLVFSAKKQKIFFLSGDHGLDLVGQVEEQIKKQSSEYRLLPEIPEHESEMISLALLATPDARLEADALRKAEAVSLRRLGFAFLLGDFEAYARDLDCREKKWMEVRGRFYGIVNRYLVTPVGFFDYFNYIVRVFGLMVVCRDFDKAREFILNMESVIRVLYETTDSGSKWAGAFRKAQESYYRGFLQALLESATVGRFSLSKSFLDLVLETSRKASLKMPEESRVRDLVKRFLLSDLGRRPYQEYWYVENKRHVRQPPLPKSFSVKRMLARVREFRRKARKQNLHAPYWPAVAFPTRPPLPWQLSLSVPRALEEPGGLEQMIRATRGGYVNPAYPDFSFVGKDECGRLVWSVPAERDQSIYIAVPSVAVTDAQWDCAIEGAPDHSLSRYLSLRKLINQMMVSSSNITYVVFPELSVPYHWALDIASRLGRAGISLIAGLENRGRGDEYKNDVLVSLATDFYGRKGNLCLIQSKIELSHEEAGLVAGKGKAFAAPASSDELSRRRPVYAHGGMSFGVLVCSDLTSIQNRSHFQGAVDALFVVEWNKDVETFGFLVESASHDLHAAVLQVNNRRFGDSRLRVPFAKPYMRDVVKIKGGDSDFFVFCSIDPQQLRDFQSLKQKPGKKRTEGVEPPSKVFKPVPIGYRMADLRKKSSNGTGSS